MTAPYPDEFRYLPKRVFKQYLIDHPFVHQYFPTGKEDFLINDSDLKAIYDQIKNIDHQQSTVTNLLTYILFSLLNHFNRKKEYNDLIKNIILSLNNNVNKDIDVNQIKKLFREIGYSISEFDNNPLFSEKDLYKFKLSLVCELEKNYPNADKTSLESISQKELLYINIKNKPFYISNENDEKLKITAAIGNLKTKYDIIKDSDIRKFLSDIDNLISEYRQRNSDINSYNESQKGLKKLKEVVESEILSDSEKLTEIVKIEARYPEILSYNSKEECKNLINSLKLYLNKNLEKSLGKRPLQYHITMDVTQTKPRTQHTLHPKITTFIKRRMLEVRRNLNAIVGPHRSSTRSISPLLEKVDQIQKGEYDTPLKDETIVNSISDATTKNNFGNLTEELQALGFLLSDLSFELTEEISVKTLFEKCKKPHLYSSFFSIFSYFVPIPGFFTLHTIFEMVAKELNTQRQVYLSVYDFGSNSDINEITQKVENYVAPLPVAKGSSSGFSLRFFC